MGLFLLLLGVGYFLFCFVLFCFVLFAGWLVDFCRGFVLFLFLCFVVCCCCCFLIVCFCF